jgi:predicted RNase H-like nuclease
VTGRDAPLAGVDGCRGGWVVATIDGAYVSRSLAAIATSFYELSAIDMPIGLPDAWGRAADSEARAVLGRRGVCIFPTPPRALLAFESYAEANAESKARFGRGLTAQTFNLFAKLREIDEVVDSSNQHRFIEAHPECSFVALTGHVLPPKRTSAGRAARRDALEPVFGPIDLRLPGSQPDDVLDAYVLLWTAQRHHRGESRIFGGRDLDSRGLVMQIVS